MAFVLAQTVGMQERPDEDQAGAGGTEEVGKNGSDGHEKGVSGRKAGERAGDVDSAADHEQGSQQRHEGRVFQVGVKYFGTITGGHYI